MTKNQQNDHVGDDISPSLLQPAQALRDGVDQARHMPARVATTLTPASPLATLQASTRSTVGGNPLPICLQRLWISFFFDGTGNNIDADQGTLKHSNIARLFNAHLPNDVERGNYRIYVPGVGTYFRDVGDEGGGTLGLVMARMGDRRLNWALERFDALLKPHLARAVTPANRIIEVNVAVFGFSRGAALARAFVNRLVGTRCVASSKGWRLAKRDVPVRVRFMGLFDTVASVGLTQSTNTTSPVAALMGGRATKFVRLNAAVLKDALPEALAFAPAGRAGADPVPGYFDGHQAWGAEQAIPLGVEDVRHFVAAHEIRNSFPVDSIWVAKNGHVHAVDNFHEVVYPGAHSDVGGGYRPGEGGKSLKSNERLSQIPLNHMYELALARGVPLRPKSAWEDDHKQDFDTSPILIALFNYYTAKLPKSDVLGHNMNASMRLYYAWRFASIVRKAAGDRPEQARVIQADKQYKAESQKLITEMKRLSDADQDAARAQALARNRRHYYLQSSYGNPKVDVAPYDAAIEDADAHRAETQDALLRMKAKRDALPDMSSLNEMITMYDTQLLKDVQAIRDVYTAKGFFGGAPDTRRRAELRPHYKALVEAYEDQFIHNRGLKDEKLFAFFEHYVHDSLSGFAKDATLPSDPRVIYLGGDEKYRYAHNGEQRDDETDRQYASAEADGKLAQNA